MLEAETQLSTDDDWTNLKIAFNRIGQAYFGSIWHEDTVLLSPGRFREGMDPKELPQRVTWPTSDPMRPFLAKMELESIYQRVGYPAPENMISGYDFVEKNLRQAAAQGALRIELLRSGETWIPYASCKSCGDISFEDSEICIDSDGQPEWVQARIEKAGIGTFVELIEFKFEEQKSQAARSSEPAPPIPKETPKPKNDSDEELGQATIQKLADVMLKVFGQMESMSEQLRDATSPVGGAEPPEPPAKKENITAQFPSPPNLAWDEVSITFFQNDAVKIKARDVEKKYTFAEMGFKDGRKGDAPNSRWGLLRDVFSTHNGAITWGDKTPDAHRKNLTKSVSEIAKTLKTFFGIRKSPFHRYRADRGYQLKLNLFNQRFIQSEEPKNLATDQRSSDTKDFLEEEADRWLEMDNRGSRAFDPSRSNDDY